MNREQFISHVESTQKAFRRFMVALCCGDSLLADDIAQESLIKAYISCDNFNSPDKFTSWIYRIGYNTFLNHKRSEKMTVGYEQAENLTACDSPDSGFKYQELYEALKLLPDRERTSILLHYMEGYSIKEIAGIVGVSADAVKQHLSRGRNHLRGYLNSNIN